MQSQSGSAKRIFSSIRRSRALPALSLMTAACALSLAGAAQAQVNSQLQSLLSAKPADVASDASASGLVRVIVQFTEPPVALMRPNIDVSKANRAEMASYSRGLRQAKAPRLAAIAQLGGRVQNTLEHAINGAVVEIQANRIATLARVPGVKSVRQVRTYQMNGTPPSVGELIGTAQLNASGNGGAGVAIAVIDSGVDYTHAAFSGPGTTAYYGTAVAGAGPTTIGDTPGVYPDGPRVKGGYDWLGETWPNGPVTPDPDPIDNRQTAADFAGHGTNSASAAAGSAVMAGQLRAGSAPEAMILAYRVCSRVANSCEGSALLNSVDSVIRYAAGDPNGNQAGANNPALPAGTRFVINMSLGSTYGNPLIDDLSEASRNAVRAGITVVASAGNSNNIPFIVGSPSSADTVISVAASQPALLTGPSVSVGAPLNISYPLGTSSSFGPAFTTAVALPLAFAGGNTAVDANVNLACDVNPPLPDLAGKVGIADRGVCGFTVKTKNAQNAGASLALIVNNAVGGGTIGMGGADPTVTIPALSIGTAEGLALKNALAVTPGLIGNFSPLGDAANVVGGVNIVDLISDFSSRGPSQSTASLKPDITAPGSNIFMAAIGSGDKGVNNSGTSFSGPLTAGVAALVLSAKPGLTPWQVKAALMNTAETNVFATKTAGGSTLAGLTRMGAGRVQADRAAATGTLAYDSVDIDPTAATYYNTALSFGPQAFTAAGASSVKRTVVVQNLGNAAKVYNISIAPRFANDLARGMVFTTSTPIIAVAPNSTATFDVIGTATGAALPTAGGLPLRLTNLDGCTTTTNPPAPVAACTNKFDDLEQDGFVTIDGGVNDTVRVPYLAYPRQASSVAVSRIGSTVRAVNTGVANTFVDVFNLVGAPDAQDVPTLVAGSETLPTDLRAVGVRYTPNAVPAPLPAGVTSGDVLEFAVSLWGPVDNWRLAVMTIELDTNNDGTTDFTVRNLNTTSNRSSAFISPGFAGTPANGFFFASAPLNSARIVLPVFPSVMGINANSRIGIRVSTTNGTSFTGSLATAPVFDRLPDSGGFNYVKLNQLAATPSVRSFSLAAGATVNFAVTANAANARASQGDKGLMLLLNENPTNTDAAVLQLLP